MSESVVANVLLPFGQLSSGRLVGVSEVDRGLACGCFCPQCGQPLIAKKGDILVHHFAHQSDAECKGAVESALHKMSKQILADRRQVRIPDAIAIYGTTKRWLSGPRTYVAEMARLEPSFGGIRPDVFFEGGGVPLAIEVCVTHPVPETKRQLLTAQLFDSIEIDMSRWIGCENTETLAAAVIWTAPREWLHHDGIKRALAGMQGAMA